MTYGNCQNPFNSQVYSLGASVLELAYGKKLATSDAQYAKVRDGAPVRLAGAFH